MWHPIGVFVGFGRRLVALSRLIKHTVSDNQDFPYSIIGVKLNMNQEVVPVHVRLGILDRGAGFKPALRDSQSGKRRFLGLAESRI
jgi:hypothetical protein